MLHVGDVGHLMVVGPTGAGKSVLLAVMALQFMRYLHAQVFVFDFGGSIRAATLAMGGDWQDLGGLLSDDAAAPAVSLQPLSRIQHTPERAWAADWLVDILEREGVSITPEVKEHLWTGADLAGFSANRGTDHHRPVRAAPGQHPSSRRCVRIASAAPTDGCSMPRPSVSAKHRSRSMKPRD